MSVSAVQVTMGLLEEGEFGVVSQINNALISAGYTKEAADVAGTPLSRRIASGSYGKAALPGLSSWNCKTAVCATGASYSLLHDFATGPGQHGN